MSANNFLTYICTTFLPSPPPTFRYAEPVLLWDYLHSKASYSQAVPSSQAKVKLTTQARKAITAEQRARHAAFDEDVAKIWQKNIEACDELAAKHNKTL